MTDNQISREVRRALSFVTGRSASISNRKNELTKTKINFYGLLCLMLVLVAAPVHGQTDTATVVGTVVDHSGAVLPDGVVTITNLGTNAKTVVKTGADGSYIATSLKIGNSPSACKPRASRKSRAPVSFLMCRIVFGLTSPCRSVR